MSNVIYKEEYFADGSIMSKTSFFNGKRNGLVREYGCETGNIVFTAHFVDDEMHGVSKYFTENSLLYEEYHIHGVEVPEDELEWYDEAIILAKPGEIISGTLYDEDASKTADVSYLDGKKHGTQIAYVQGVKTGELNYKNGILNGRCRNYGHLGELHFECNYLDGEMHGKCDTYCIPRKTTYFIHGEETTKKEWEKHILIVTLSEIEE